MLPWQALLDWWFGPSATAAEIGASRYGLWFGKRDEQDAEARERFADRGEQALAGALQAWSADPRGWLAHVLPLDQLPGMIHRDMPLARGCCRFSATAP